MSETTWRQKYNRAWSERQEYYERAIKAESALAECREREKQRDHELREASAILRNIVAKGEIRNHATGRRELTPPVADSTRFAAESWLAAHEPLPETPVPETPERKGTP